MLSTFFPLTLHLLLLLLSQLANSNPNELDSRPQNHITNPAPLSFHELTKLNKNGFNGQKPINNAIFPFLTEFNNNDGFDTQNNTDCWWRPFICRQGLPPIAPILCCNNQCVNVRRSRDNCGLCGVRCPFGWKCCRGVCIDAMISPFHCGECSNKCRFPSLCLEGRCRPTGSKPPKIPKTPKTPCHAKPPCTSPPKRPKPPCSKPPSASPPKFAKPPMHPKPPFASPPEQVKPPCISPPKHPKPPCAPPPEHVKPPCALPPKHAKPPSVSPPKQATPPCAPSPMEDDEE